MGLACSIRAKSSKLGNTLTSIPGGLSGRALRSFSYSCYVFRVIVPAVTVQGRANAQKKFEGVAKTVAVIAIQSVGAIVDCELGADTDVKAIAVRQIADVTDRVCAHGKDPRVSRGIQNQLLAGFFYALPAEVNCVPTALIIGFNQERLRFALAGVVVLAPDKTIRPVAVVSERQVVNCRCRRAMPVEFGIDGFRAFDVTERNLQREISRRVP